MVLNSGLRWHVGDGTTINAWKELWIPLTPRLLPLFEKPENCSFELVAEFIDSELRLWKRDLILEHWPSDYAHQILSIPLRSHRNPDFRFWAPSKG
ncbi:hypothetical protein FRX31_015631, partial [Thalictrum thalictroides]